MPTRRPSLDLRRAAAHVAARSFRPASADRVGIELEMLPVTEAGTRPDHELVADALAGLTTLASGTAVTFEPGGQIELSSPPAGLDAACAGLDADLAAVEGALARVGVGLIGLGLDPAARPPYPTPRSRPRYEAMASYFARQGGRGATMMCATAGLQVNLDCERSGPCPTYRFGSAHLVGPTLAASFANSPLAEGCATGWKSSRLANWWLLDPGRTAPAAAPGSGPSAWPDYVLRAPVMMIRAADGSHVPLRRPLSFAGWLADGHEAGYPGLDDLDYHLTTLFPPVRPRGWLELRMFDSLPGPWWRVPVAVSAALLYDAAANEVAAWAARRTTGLWIEAARCGLDHPLLASSARACFTAALEALARWGAGPTFDTVAAYHERFVSRGRTPADEVLARFHGRGGSWRPGEWMSAARPAQV